MNEIIMTYLSEGNKALAGFVVEIKYLNQTLGMLDALGKFMSW